MMLFGFADFSPWGMAVLIYAAIAIGTVLPALRDLRRGVKLHPGGAAFQESPHFSDRGKKQLEQHFSRIVGTLGFWKKQAEIYRYLHYYCLVWTILLSVTVPFLAQAISADPWSKWFLTAVSAHAAMALAFHRAFKVDANFRAFRQGESQFYDLYRRILDRPITFGKDEDEQIANYFDQAENLRMFVRNSEIDNLPSLDEVKKQLSDERERRKTDSQDAG
jgi:Protein of unknown function (DUF4231)